MRFLPFYLVNDRLLPLLVQHHQSVPILLDNLYVKLRLDVHLTDRLEILLKIPKQIREALLVSVPRRHLLVLEFRTVRGQFLHLDQRWREGALLHQAHLLADPQMKGARQLPVLLRPPLGLGIVQRMNRRRLREHVVERRDIRYQGLLVRFWGVHV